MKEGEMAILYTGNLPELHIIRGVLEAEGIVSWIRDEQMKIFDPFITGGSVLQADLMVWEKDWTEAQACLPESKQESAPLTRHRRPWLFLIFLFFVLPMLVSGLARLLS